MELIAPCQLETQRFGDLSCGLVTSVVLAIGGYVGGYVGGNASGNTLPTFGLYP